MNKYNGGLLMKAVLVVFFMSLGFWMVIPTALAVETAVQGVQAFLDSIGTMDFPIADEAIHQKRVEQTDAYLDLEAMGQKALGIHWTEMTPAQQKSFMDLLWKLIESIAYPRTKSFLGTQKISYEAPKPLAKGFEVSSMVKDQEAALDVPVVYDLYQEDGHWKIYDIFMDGISMTEDLKFQFDKIIKDSSFSGLLTRMSERLRKAQKETTGRQNDQKA